ncbi:MAG: hypothetical protein QGI95_02000 [Dehalococcoidales bacterium]|nr:hypothetical protein [Dehalococcoidales bacterium]MDP7525065.1 hypothetical protein [Dehalococcoidales bacterium]
MAILSQPRTINTGAVFGLTSLCKLLKVELAKVDQCHLRQGN